MTNYTGDIKRLIVFADLNDALKTRGDGNAEATFATLVTDSLAKCGIATEYQKKAQVDNRLTLEEHKAPAPSERGLVTGKFNPDAVLDIQAKSVMTSSNRLVIVYDLALTDMKTQTVVWSAEMNFLAAWYPGENLAAALVDRLRNDAVINSACVPPPVPRA
ncbi:hypothetical protein [Telmatospirillum sp.]|uniref:hypothetical protein n=1 Tax=Telmatospirillum sp. TaxID=2079197 RepID=UPI0028524936|nr:hypothetical protein [Telmatospirillum sp.]